MASWTWQIPESFSLSEANTPPPASRGCLTGTISDPDLTEQLDVSLVEDPKQRAQGPTPCSSFFFVLLVGKEDKKISHLCFYFPMCPRAGAKLSPQNSIQDSPVGAGTHLLGYHLPLFRVNIRKKLELRTAAAQSLCRRMCPPLSPRVTYDPCLTLSFINGINADAHIRIGAG